ncbi:MAG: regulatory protein RecX [Chitinophagales bacterium]
MSSGNRPSIRISKEKALQKIRHFCGYQERSHKEVKDKLYTLGLWKSEVEEILAQLIEEDYMNEERFAKTFAGGKFRMKQWGRVKIRSELKKRNVSEYCIRQALNSIDEEAYQNTMDKLADKKLFMLKNEKNIFTKKRRLQDWLLQKGFEYDLVNKKTAAL